MSQFLTSGGQSSGVSALASVLPMNIQDWFPLGWTVGSPRDCKEIQPVHPKGDHSWVFVGRNDVEAETPLLWAPDAKS